MEELENLSLSDRKIIVGVDFGTTYSGLAWAETRRPDHIHVIDTWPSSIGTPDGASSVKVPSEIRYRRGGYQWGFQIPSIVERHQWFKIALDKPANQSSSRRTSRANNVDAEDLLKDYLTSLGNHLIYTLEQKLGAAFRNIPLEYVLTVPAIWSELAKEKTLRACQAAGFRTDAPISLVSEPEAAAIYGLHGLDPGSLKIGDTFVLCDAGGGTVDLISYTITRLSPTLEIKEAAAGTGGICGSTRLNRRFGDFLTHKLGGEEGWDTDTFAEAMERFDSVIKKEYSPSTHSECTYSIPVAGLANNDALGVKRGRFSMQPSDLRDIIDPVIYKVIDLVWGQIKATKVEVKAILLVGGFGQNNYLKERLRSDLAKQNLKIEVIQPPHAWTAVVRGTVMKGLANCDQKLAVVQVGLRTARKHYGIVLTQVYDATKHSEQSRSWDPFDCKWVAPQFTWFICKDDPVDESVPSIIDFSFRYPVEDGIPKVSRVTIYCDSVSSIAPNQKNCNVVRLVQLTAHLTDLKESWYELEGNNGKKIYIIDACIEASYGSASTEYTLIFEGKRYSTVTAEYV